MNASHGRNDAARDHLAGVGMATDCPGCDDPTVTWGGWPDELDDARAAAGLAPRTRFEHALQWGRHDGWSLGEDEDLMLEVLVEFDTLHLLLADPRCRKKNYLEPMLRKVNPTCGSKGCLSHGNGPVAPWDVHSVPRWTGSLTTEALDPDTPVLFTLRDGDANWTRVGEMLLRVVWLDQDQAIAERRSPDHRCFQQPLRQAVRELHDQGDGTLVVRGMHGVLVKDVPPHG